jgi:hypothetical protein
LIICIFITFVHCALFLFPFFSRFWLNQSIHSCWSSIALQLLRFRLTLSL